MVLAKQSQLTYMHFTVFDTDGITPLTGQAGSCTSYLAEDGATAAEAVSISEIGVTGHYYASFTPLNTGTYDLEVTCPDDRVVGDSFEVYTDDIDDLGSDLTTIESKIDTVDTNVDDILIDTNEMQGKLPTNNIMGSSVKDDKDDEIDAILLDTGTTIPATLTTIEGKIDTVDTNVDAILVDTNEMQGKLPTNNIMGSSDKDDHDTDIDAILVDTSTMEPLVSTNLDTTVSSRSDFDETTDPVELLDSGGAAGTSAAELVTDIEADLSANHGAGQWDGTDSDWTSAEREQIRFRLAMDGSQTDPTTNTGTIEDILSDTNETQGKLPDNYIMGSGVSADMNDEIDSILVDTGTSIPATLTTIEGKIDTVDTNVDTILVDTNEMQGKLPTNNIMGSSVKSDKDDEIDAIKAKTDNLPADPASQSTTNTSITNSQTAIIAEVDANEVKIDAVQTDVTAIKAVTDTIGSLTALVDAIWDEVVNGSTHFVTNSTGEALSLIRGLVQQNYMLDSTTYNSDNLLTAGRLRIFTTAAEVSAATDGGSGEGEIATFDISVVAEGVDGSLVKTYKVERS